MADMLITYDLRAPGRDYEKIYEYLRKLPAKRALESVWLAKTSKSAEIICKDLMELIDGNDRLFVARVDDWSSFGAMNNVANWLNGKD